MVSVEEAGVATLTSGAGHRAALWSSPNNLMDMSEDFRLVTFVNQSSESQTPSDGLVFVMQAKTASDPVWYTHHNQAMGAYPTVGGGVNGAASTLTKKGIPRSFAIEFDLYVNAKTSAAAADAFDAYSSSIGSLQVKGQHIANTYPGSDSAYIDTRFSSGGLLPVSYNTRLQQHWNVQNNLTLSDGNWTKLEVNWIAATAQLSYRTSSETRGYDSGWLQMNPTTIKEQLGLPGNQYAYWGFTGYSGNLNPVTQKAIFQQIPGLVDADVLYVVNDVNGNSIDSGSTIKGNTELEVVLVGSYKGGRTTWKNVDIASLIPEQFEIIPNTTQMMPPGSNDLAELTNLADEEVWIGNQLYVSEKIEELNLTSPKVAVKFKVRAKNQTANVVMTSKFRGSTMIEESEPFNLTIEEDQFELGITTPEEGQVFLNDIEEFPVVFDWRNASGAVTATVSVDDTLIETIEDLQPTIEMVTQSVPLIETFKTLDFGSHTITVTLTNVFNETVTRSITFKKEDTPRLTVATEADKITNLLGSNIHFDLTWLDEDSSLFNVYMKVNDGEEQIIASDINTNELSYDFETSSEDIVSGDYKFEFYVKDDSGHTSNVESITPVVLKGGVYFSDEPIDFQKEELVLGSGVQKVTLSPISVIDSTKSENPWNLQVSLEENFYYEGLFGIKLFAPANFLTYRTEDSIATIDTVGSIIYNHQSLNRQPVVISQEGKNGFYVDITKSLHSGTYKGTIIWRLENAPM
nr:hypothetical protein [Vagococcus sp. DIV0080]